MSRLSALRHVLPQDESLSVVAWEAETQAGPGTFFVAARAVEIAEGVVQHLAVPGNESAET